MATHRIVSTDVSLKYSFPVAGTESRMGQKAEWDRKQNGTESGMGQNGTKWNGTESRMGQKVEWDRK